MSAIERYIENPTIANLRAIIDLKKCKKKQLLRFIDIFIQNKHWQKTGE